MNIYNIVGSEYDVVYLTPEVLAHEDLQTGSGGLGVVAGEVLQEAEEGFGVHGIRMLAISLYPSHGYQRQVVVTTPHTEYLDVTYESQRHQEIAPDTGVRIRITLAGRTCTIVVRMLDDQPRSNTAILLLDTDVEENPQDFRMITRTLYGGTHATSHFSELHEAWHDITWLRVLQAAVLGLGAYNLLRDLNVGYRIVHLNDSHGALFSIRQYGQERTSGIPHEQALERVRARTRFTNHTMLDSGNPQFPYTTIEQICGTYPGFDRDTLLHIDERDPYSLSMTETACMLAGQGNVNGVSKHHATIADRRWPGYGIFPITNGVGRRYQHPLFQELREPGDIPSLKRRMREEVLEIVKAQALDAGYIFKGTPPPDALTLAWVRRHQEYKRPGLIFHSAEHGLMQKLLEWGWVTILWGGYAHPDDVGMGNEWTRILTRIRDLPNVLPVFNYRLNLMRPTLKAGADVWLNTPFVGHEACGTSWMSAMLNGALVVSINDGGVREAEHVVRFGSSDPGNWHEQYPYDARELWQTLVPQIMHLREHDPALLRFLYEAKLEAEEMFAASRMVADYKRLLYRL